MKYLHGHHAGNFADVHKHVTLMAVLAAITRKEKPFLFVDTHAGRGMYRDHAAAQRDGEAQTGVEQVVRVIADDLLRGVPRAADDPILAYTKQVLTLRRDCADPRACPGSPWLAAQMMRPDDRGAAFELQAAEHAALRRTLEYWPQFVTDQDDGLKRLRGFLPPPERRALVLIDPPYEDPREEPRRVLETLRDALLRFPTGIYMVWYPIKTERDADHWRSTLRAVTDRTLLLSQLGVHPLDSRAGLNASGVAIFNPPYLLDRAMATWLTDLHGMLDPQSRGTAELCMLGSRG